MLFDMLFLGGIKPLFNFDIKSCEDKLDNSQNSFVPLIQPAKAD